MRESTMRRVAALTLLVTLGGTGAGRAQPSTIRVRGAPWLSDRLIEGLRSSFAEASPELQLDWQAAGANSAVIGLFDGSDLFTMFSVYVGRELGEGKRLVAGWRSLDLDYDKGSNLAFDARMSGPIVGLVWRF